MNLTLPKLKEGLSSSLDIGKIPTDIHNKNRVCLKY